MQKPFSIPCIILSGGKSKRMKEDKSLLPFALQNSLVEFQYLKYSKLFNEVFISSKIDKFEFLKNKKRIIFDEEKTIYSPILALKTILEKFEKVFIVPVDTPFIDFETIEKLINSSNSFDITIAQTPLKTHNLCGVFSKNINSFINFMIKNDIHKINYLIKNSNSQIISFENENEFLNLNNQDEYKEALNIIKKTNI